MAICREMVGPVLGSLILLLACGDASRSDAGDTLASTVSTNGLTMGDADVQGDLATLDLPQPWEPPEPYCPAEISVFTDVVLVEAGAEVRLDVAWFGVYACTVFGSFMFLSSEIVDPLEPPPIGSPEGGRLFHTHPIMEWTEVESGVAYPVTFEDSNGDSWEVGTIEVVDLVGPEWPAATIYGVVTASFEDEWTLEGTFRATRCTEFGLSIPCE